jgi:hypothetical protein
MSTHEHIEHNKHPFGVLLLRVMLGAIAVVAVPPFVILAIAPMLLMLAPVALVAIPFMITAFAGEASQARPVPHPFRTHSQAAAARAIYPRLVRTSARYRRYRAVEQVAFVSESKLGSSD